MRWRYVLPLVYAASWFLSGATYAQDVGACVPTASLPPKVHFEKLPQATPEGYTHGLLYTCRTPTGYQNVAWVFQLTDLSVAVRWAEKALTLADLEAACEGRCKTTDELSPEARAHRARILETYGGRALVTTNGASLSRPVYALNPDGTRNTRAVPGARVAVGDKCNHGKRIGTTNFYSVQGRENVATAAQDVLGDVYAVCTFSAPTGIN